MKFYLDASALVSVVADEPTAGLVFSYLTRSETLPRVSDFALAECSAALAKLGRTGHHREATLTGMYADLDRWALSAADSTLVEPIDISTATELVRRPDLSLRAPDAIHIAAAHRLGATLLTLDQGMARAAAALGVPYLNPAEGLVPGEPKD